MKKLLILIGGSVLVVFLAVTLLAYGPGWNRGHHMGGYWGSNPGSCWDYDRGYKDLSKEENNQLKELKSKFYNENARLRNEICSKSSELNSLLNTTNPDSQKLKALQRELSDLRAEMGERRLAYDLEARKILPESRFSGGYGRGYYSHHMRGFGPGIGNSPGRCWD